MSDYIKREDAVLGIAAFLRFSQPMARRIVDEIPSADVIEQKHGKWIYQFHEDEVGVTCSECEGYAESFARWIYDEGYRIDYNYCPNCGARMDGE